MIKKKILLYTFVVPAFCVGFVGIVVWAIKMSFMLGYTHFKDCETKIWSLK